MVRKEEEKIYKIHKIRKIWNFLIYGTAIAIGVFLIWLYSAYIFINKWKKTEEYFLINKQRNRVKSFRKFKDINNKQNDFIEIEYSCVYKSSSKTVYKWSWIETLEDARKGYKTLLEEGWKKTNIFKRCF